MRATPTPRLPPHLARLHHRLPLFPSPAPLHSCGNPRSLMQRLRQPAHAWRQPRRQRQQLLIGPERRWPAKRQQRRLPNAQPASQQRKPLGLRRHESGLPRRGTQHTLHWRRPGRQALTAQLCERQRQRWRLRVPSRPNVRQSQRSDDSQG